MLNVVSSRQPVRVVIISGLSGSGKSTAIHALEDVGFFCIDNLPIVLMPKLVELIPRSPQEIEQVALVVDAREGRFLDDFQEVVERIREEGSRVEVVFLDCTDTVLVRRYNETRRRHPLAQQDSIEEGIQRERALLAVLRRAADQVIDTSDMNPHMLRQMVQDHFTRIQPGHEMNMALVSFGFKYGIPAGADLVFDVRFLPNPYFVPQMREQTGRDQDVATYVLENGDAETFLQHVSSYLATFRPLYDREGKSYLSVCVGCTGGRHRSVAMVEALGRRLHDTTGPLVIRHRDVDRNERA